MTKAKTETTPDVTPASTECGKGEFVCKYDSLGVVEFVSGDKECFHKTFEEMQGKAEEMRAKAEQERLEEEARKAAIHVGDVVRLKSGGPDMVVSDTPNEGVFNCSWFCDNQENHTGLFRQDCLDKTKAKE